MEEKMGLFGFDPTNPERSEKLDPKKHGYDYGDGSPIVFDSNLFQECSSCKGVGKINEEKCLTCDGTGAVQKDV